MGRKREKEIRKNDTQIRQKFFVPALQRDGLSYIPAMRELKRIFLAAFLLIIFAGGVWLGFTVPRWMKLGSGLHMESTATVVEQVQTLSDLVTVKYVLEKVVILEDVKWYGENRVLLLAHGIVKAGIDLKRITPDDVTISGKIISLRLPPPQIMDASNKLPGQTLWTTFAARHGRTAFWTKLTSGRGWNWNYSCVKRALNRLNFAEKTPSARHCLIIRQYG